MSVPALWPITQAGGDARRPPSPHQWGSPRTHQRVQQVHLTLPTPSPRGHRPLHAQGPGMAAAACATRGSTSAAGAAGGPHHKHSPCTCPCSLRPLYTGRSGTATCPRPRPPPGPAPAGVPPPRRRRRPSRPGGMDGRRGTRGGWMCLECHGKTRCTRRCTAWPWDPHA